MRAIIVAFWCAIQITTHAATICSERHSCKDYNVSSNEEITCSGEYSCRGITASCHATVTCHGEHSCKYGTFGGNSNVTCHGERSCQYGTFGGDSTAFCTATELIAAACAHSTFKEQSFATCSGHYACGESKVEDDAGLECTGVSSCGSIEGTVSESFRKSCDEGQYSDYPSCKDCPANMNSLADYTGVGNIWVRCECEKPELQPTDNQGPPECRCRSGYHGSTVDNCEKCPEGTRTRSSANFPDWGTETERCEPVPLVTTSVGEPSCTSAEVATSSEVATSAIPSDRGLTSSSDSPGMGPTSDSGGLPSDETSSPPSETPSETSATTSSDSADNLMTILIGVSAAAVVIVGLLVVVIVCQRSKRTAELGGDDSVIPNTAPTETYYTSLDDVELTATKVAEASGETDTILYNDVDEDMKPRDSGHFYHQQNPLGNAVVEDSSESRGYKQLNQKVAETSTKMKVEPEDAADKGAVTYAEPSSPVEYKNTDLAYPKDSTTTPYMALSDCSRISSDREVLEETHSENDYEDGDKVTYTSPFAAMDGGKGLANPEDSESTMTPYMALSDSSQRISSIREALEETHSENDYGTVIK